MRNRILLSLLFLLFVFSAYPQDKSNIKFGVISAKDFSKKIYSIDSNASAVALADIGNSKIEGNSKGGFSLVFKHYKRIHILNKNGFDIGTVSVYLYNNGSDEVKIDKLKASTYNLENGKVVETKLDLKSAVYKDKLERNWTEMKFTFPNLKEGSIIEFEYTKVSDFLNNFEPWNFQGTYPRLWSEYNFALPDFLGYAVYSQGYLAYAIKTKKTKTETFRIVDPKGVGASDFMSFDCGVSENRWVLKDVPALKEENYTSSITNHNNRIEFQLSEYREPYDPKPVMATWPQAAEDLLKKEYFGEQLSRDNGWLKETLTPFIKAAKTEEEKAQKIYAFVRDNFTCTDYSSIYLDQTLKNVLKSKSGNVAEINMLLCAMLRYADIKADPVLLSTRSHGFAYANYPILSKYNYVITKAVMDGKDYFLDATEPRLGFAYLPLRCYNGHARAINSSVDSIELSSESITERKITNVFVANNDKGIMIGHLQQTLGYYESLNLRNKIKEKGKEELQKDMQKVFGSDATISKYKVDSVDKYERDITLEYDFDLNNEKEDIIYFNPLFGEGYKENPFKSAERLYPVEMPYKIDETFNLQLEVPAGYEVDEMPKSILVKLNEANEGLFEYRVSISGSSLSLRSRIKMNRAYFYPDEYQMLREFFNLVVKKQAEQIVFKKKK